MVSLDEQVGKFKFSFSQIDAAARAEMLVARVRGEEVKSKKDLEEKWGKLHEILSEEEWLDVRDTLEDERDRIASDWKGRVSMLETYPWLKTLERRKTMKKKTEKGKAEVNGKVNGKVNGSTEKSIDALLADAQNAKPEVKAVAKKGVPSKKGVVVKADSNGGGKKFRKLTALDFTKFADLKNTKVTIRMSTAGKDALANAKPVEGPIKYGRYLLPVGNEVAYVHLVKADGPRKL